MSEKRCERVLNNGMGPRCDQVATGHTEDDDWYCDEHLKEEEEFYADED